MWVFEKDYDRSKGDTNVVVAFDVRLLREVEVAAIGLALAGEGGLQVRFGLGAFQCGIGVSLGSVVALLVGA